jgi:hypothetical protein
MTSRDRKDLPHSQDPQQVRAPETHTDRMVRKEKESDALDEALQETFPTSDPISPFVPAVPLRSPGDDDASAGANICAHDGCRCATTPPAIWCSDSCREAQQGYVPMPGQSCQCGHSECAARQGSS